MSEATPPNSAMRNSFHIFTLTALALSPLYTTFQSNPAYFIVNDIWPVTMYTLIALNSVLLPVALAGVLYLLHRFVPKVHPVFHAAIVAGTGALCFMPMTAKIQVLPWILSLIIAAALGLTITRLLAKNEFVSFGIALAAPITLLFPVMFALDTGISEVLHESAVESASHTLTLTETSPVVVIVFDELPLISLLDADGNIDARRFPNFADLAGGATWYSNATTVRDSTLKALPAILTGNYPRPDSVLPLRHNYPDTLFSWLENTHAIHSIEQATSLSPVSNQEKGWLQDRRLLKVFAGDLYVLYLHTILPETLANAWVPMDDGVWGGFLAQSASIEDTDTSDEIHNNKARLAAWRKDRKGDRNDLMRIHKVDEFFDEIADYPESTLHFLHTILPHYPWDFMPSGRYYNRNSWNIKDDEFDPALKAPQSRQSHLIQLAAVDALLGRTLQKLRDAQRFDDTLIVIVADHGASFAPDVERRTVSEDNYASIAFVPLIIKYPGQQEGRVDSSNAQTIDIVPTILDALSDQALPDLDGRSLLNPNATPPLFKRITNSEDVIFEHTEAEFLQARADEVRRHVRILGLTKPSTHVFNAAQLTTTIGKEDTTLQQRALDATITCPDIPKLARFDTDADYVHALLIGTVTLESSGDTSDLAVVATINGLVAGTTLTFPLENATHFALLIDDALLKKGGNEIGLFVVPAQTP